MHVLVPSFHRHVVRTIPFHPSVDFQGQPSASPRSYEGYECFSEGVEEGDEEGASSEGDEGNEGSESDEVDEGEDDEGSNDTEAGDIRNYVLGAGVDTPELVMDDDDEPDRKRVRT